MEIAAIVVAVVAMAVAAWFGYELVGVKRRVAAVPADGDIFKALRELDADGIAWGEMKQVLFETINEQIKPAREEYDRLIANPGVVESELKKGAEKAREISVPYLAEIREALGNYASISVPEE